MPRCPCLDAAPAGPVCTPQGVATAAAALPPPPLLLLLPSAEVTGALADTLNSQEVAHPCLTGTHCPFLTKLNMKLSALRF